MNEVDPYIAALIAAGAAIVGGVVVAAANLWASTLQRHHERAVQEKRDQRELRQAGRLILVELDEIEQTLLQTAASQLTWRSVDRQLPALAWAQFRATLAAYVSDEVWQWVAAAYRAADGANWHVIELEREFNTDGPVHFVEKDWARDAFLAVRGAMEVLESEVGPRAGIYTYTGHVSADELWEERVVRRVPRDPDSA